MKPDNRFRATPIAVVALVLAAGGVMVAAGAFAQSSKWVIATLTSAVAVTVTRVAFRVGRSALRIPYPGTSLDPRVRPLLDRRRAVVGTWICMLISGAMMFAAGYLGPRTGWRIIVPFTFAAGLFIIPSYQIDRLVSLAPKPARRAGDRSRTFPPEAEEPVRAVVRYVIAFWIGVGVFLAFLGGLYLLFGGNDLVLFAALGAGVAAFVALRKKRNRSALDEEPPDWPTDLAELRHHPPDIE